MAQPQVQQFANGRRLPQIRIWMDVPMRPADVASDRKWKELNKGALEDTLKYHHKHHIPRHFQPDARQRYGYMARGDKYNKMKQRRFGKAIDMVFSGRARTAFTKRRPEKMTTQFGSKGLTGTLKFRFPFKGGTGKQKKTNKKKGITPKQLVAEMQRVTAEEGRTLAEYFLSRFWSRYSEMPRRRKRIGSRQQESRDSAFDSATGR